MQDLTKALAKALREYREENGLSAEACAKQLGIGKTTYLSFEKGTGNPTLNTVTTIAHNMGTEPLLLLGLKDILELSSVLLSMEALGVPHSLHSMRNAVDTLDGFVRFAEQCCSRNMAAALNTISGSQQEV